MLRRRKTKTLLSIPWGDFEFHQKMVHTFRSFILDMLCFMHKITTLFQLRLLAKPLEPFFQGQVNMALGENFAAVP